MPAVLRIALPVPLPTLFDYLPPEHGEAVVGGRVTVPFGRGCRTGLVVAAGADSGVPADQLKRVERVIDARPLLDTELMQSLRWAADYWLGAPGEVYTGALPVALRGTRAVPSLDSEGWVLSDAGHEALRSGRRRGTSRALLLALQDGARSTDTLQGQLDSGWRAAARRLRNAGLIHNCAPPPEASVRPAQKRGDPHTSPDPPRPPPAVGAVPSDDGPQLNPGQQTAIDAVADSFGHFQPFVLDGVTGSGKTEVYIHLIQKTLAAGRQALLLVPEIGLAPQNLRRLRQRLGVEVDVLHSNRADGARMRSWLRARDGRARVILGTRSALFTPLPRAGLIIVDEEHDASYKQQDGFRYHGRDLALVRGRALNVPVLLGSATPSLETLANVANARYHRLHLPHRTGEHSAPTVEIIDVRSQRLQNGLSPRLLQAVHACVARGEQALVFRNRRGYAPVLLCHACGWHAECPRCERPMTLHARQRRLRCHHCGRERPVPDQCPDCGHAALTPQGHGTERLEESLRTRFATVPILRIDSETMRRRDAFTQTLQRLDRDEAAILVGTQMLAKGHDLPNLTLVAIVGVDEGLNSIDYRATERLAQLIVQVAGRAGRARKPGRVLLQTHHPDHPLLHTLLRQGYAAVAAELLDERKTLQLPPFGRQILLRAEAREREHVDAFLHAAQASLPAHPALRCAGPMPAPMPLRAGRQRGQLLLEADPRSAIAAAMRDWHRDLGKLATARRVRWSLDVDPVDLY